MDILEKRIHNTAVLRLIQTLKYDGQPIELVGSASLRSQRYYSDYDLFTIVPTQINHEKFNRILEKISLDPNYYPIELKVQYLNGKKTRLHPQEGLTPPLFRPGIRPIRNGYFKSGIDFVKLDLVIYDEYTFTEASIIYKLHDEFTEKDYIEGLTSDIKEYQKEGGWFKVLKRLFNLYRLKGDKPAMVKLTRFFNSSVGLMYQTKSNLEAIRLVRDAYKDDKILQQKISINMKQLDQPASATELSKMINDKAKAYIEQNKILLL